MEDISMNEVLKSNGTMALVDETLTKEEVLSLLNMDLLSTKDINNYIDILKGNYTSWDGTVFDGYIVSHTTRTATPETINDFMPVLVKSTEYYFMEVTLEEAENPMKNCHLWKPTFHRLLPITENYMKRPVFNGNLAEYIVGMAYRDTWDYTHVPMTEAEHKEAVKKDWYFFHNHKTKVVPLTKKDITGLWTTPITPEEQKAKEIKDKKNEEELLNRFRSGDLPAAEDDVWYSISATIDSRGFGDYTLERKVIDILRDRGYSVQIVGERDSFGWVTRGISVNGNIMCLI